MSTHPGDVLQLCFHALLWTLLTFSSKVIWQAVLVGHTCLPLWNLFQQKSDDHFIVSLDSTRYISVKMLKICLVMIMLF